MDKYQEVLERFRFSETFDDVKKHIDKILKEHLAENVIADVYKKLYNCIDYTSLNSNDNDLIISDFVDAINTFSDEHPDIPNVAGICVYPNFTPVVKNALEDDNVRIVAVAGSFPSAQTYTEVKVAETSLAILDGADEIDIVMPLGTFLSHDYETLTDEIGEIKHACGDKLLKVILETGALNTANDVMNASILSIFSGADFIKTSTGKIAEGATPEAVYVMCKAIKSYYEAHQRKIGIKVSGNVSTVEKALEYYTIVKEVLGEEWLDNRYFRIGSSKLRENLLPEILKYSL